MTRIEQTQRLIDELNDGKISRGQFVKRASALGLGVGALGTILAACGGDDSAEPAAAPADEPAAPAPEEPAPDPEPAPEPEPALEGEPDGMDSGEAGGATISTADVDATGLAAVDTDAGKIAVANVDGEYFAFDDTCTHQGCSLSTGSLNGTNVTCPCHGSTFDVTSGEVVNGPASRPVMPYTVTVDGEEIQIELA